MLKLFQDIKIVNGYTRSVLHDMTRGDYHFIPKLLASIINKYDSKKEYTELYRLYGNKYADLFQEYYTFLLEHELIFDINACQVPFFDDLNCQYNYPFEIDCITICLNEKNCQFIKKAVERGIFILVKNFKLIVFEGISIQKLKEVIHILSFNNPVTIKITITKNKKTKGLKNSKLIFIEFSPIQINEKYFESTYYCQKFPFLENRFYVYSEALLYNPYFHKNLFIGNKGEIKNTHHSLDIFGYLYEVENKEDLLKIIHSNIFQILGTISKNKIEICKNCELRQMCTDNRIPIQENGYWKHSSSCSYNPYICKWNTEKGFIPSEKCGVYHEKKGFIPNKQQIGILNEQLWKE